MAKREEGEWKPTACGLCYANCGILVQTGGENGREITRVKGDKNHPVSKGYTCNKALSIDFYQNGADRLKGPMRRREDGTFEQIDWDTAIREVAEKMVAIRDEHGGDKIFRYGGGNQGGHLGGAYFGPVMASLGMKYKTNALAQEKTGWGWLQNRIFGGGIHGEMDDAQCVLIIGKNPWQSNGLQRARVMLRQASKDPNRTLIVIDPRRTESAELADIHLAVKPGRDVWLLSAMIAHIVQEDLAPLDWLEEHTVGYEGVLNAFKDIDVDAYSEYAGLEPSLVKQAARAVGEAETAAYYEDLGIQMGLHSTLGSYLNMLLVLVTGNFGHHGTAAMPTGLAGGFLSGPIGELDEDWCEADYPKSPVTGDRIYAGLVPCNTVPDEILTDHPDRYRAMFVEAGNPVHSMADSQKWREALQALDLVVVIDVAMTETAREADYILPPPTQYEKWDATFFNFEYPANVHHFRKPILEPVTDVLPEQEIHSRLVEAIGAFDESILEPLKEAAEKGLDEFGLAFMTAAGEHPEIFKFMSHVLYRTLGPTLPDGAAAGALYWGASQQYVMSHADKAQRAGFEGEGPELANNLFKAILNGHSGTVFGISNEEDMFSDVGHGDKKLRINVGEMIAELPVLEKMEDLVETTKEFPLILAAGERRAYTAMTAIRNPAWLKGNDATTMSINPVDAGNAGIPDGGKVRVTTEAGSAEVHIRIDEAMKEGTLSLPNGLGLYYPNEKGEDEITGVSVNELTALSNKDKFFGTPHHKFVPARIEAI